MQSTAIVWFRQDLRLEDNPALDAALRAGHAIVPVFIWSPEDEGEWRPGSAGKWWLHQSLGQLDDALQRLGVRLVRRRAESAGAELVALVKACKATAVYWNRRYEPGIIERDAAIEASLSKDGIPCTRCNGSLLFEPWDVKTQSGTPYKVFTPFWKQCRKKLVRVRVLPGPKEMPTPAARPDSIDLDDLRLEPEIDWAGGFCKEWQPGEAGAQKALAAFVYDALTNYAVGRNRPDTAGTSRLSPHLHFGEIGPRQVWQAVHTALGADARRALPEAADVYLSEIGWREFAYHLLYYFPDTTTMPLRTEFHDFPWTDNRPQLRAWQRGKTGYPIVDAGMRELWETGWMHNRVRMIVASFLVKDLMLPWQAGAAWFWDTLVDADLASNTLGWQWTAGCGADAAPYFRVFNPTAQGRKFDPQGAYVGRYVPELAKLPPRWIHTPWEAPGDVLEAADVVLGESYPQPLVDHAEARIRALQAYKDLRSRAS
jgi:deoxyribodipyrimidine photo-lyase